MNWRFWQKTENRSGYTDLIIDSVIRSAEGEVRTASATAALEAASSLYGNCFSVARHSGPRALTPSVLSEAARNLLRHGESVWLLGVRNGSIELLPCSSWTITGGYRETDWRYKVEISGPTKSVSKTVGSDGVLHWRYSVDALQPWQGVGPMQSASKTASLAGKLEGKLDEESSAPSALLLPVPQDGGDGGDEDPLKPLKSDIGKARGGALLLETTAAGWGEGMPAAPRKDLVPSRLGPELQEQMVQLRKEVFADVLRACGVPSALFDDSDGTAQREAYRRFVMLSVEGLAAKMQEEISRKLEVEVDLDFRSLWAHDVVGRASAFKALVAAEMDADEARDRVGF